MLLAHRVETSLKPRALDLFCGAGGATKGLQRAGFHVTGVDINPQPRYCGDAFHQADALTFPLDGFDFIWASPPCQAHTSMKTMHNARSHADLVPATRAMLLETGRPYVIENVQGAPLIDPILLCGTMFNLGCDGAELRRHRLFECSFPILFPECRHGSGDTVGVYGGHLRNRRRARTIGIYGEGCRDSGWKFDKGVADFGVEQGRRAMGIEWMTIAELCQAIPPSYSEFIGNQFLASDQT
jgi:DNA (cytosine-5)-methyltransferase 1